MARVNVDSQALSDARFGVLAGLMGIDDADYALGRMVRVWMQCIERETYVITKQVIVALFRGEVRAPEWLVCAELAEEIGDSLRIKGTRGRIEYLAEKRKNARKNGRLGGRPRKPTLVSKNNQHRTSAETPPAPAPAPAPAQSKTEEEERSRVRGNPPPTLEEVTAYIRERKSPIDPEHFHAHYAANGWVQASGQRIKNWKQAVITWEKNERKRNSGRSNQRNRDEVLADEIRDAERSVPS